MVVALARREDRTRLGVEADDLLRPQVGDGLDELDAGLVDDVDLAGKGSQRHFFYFFRQDANFEHKNRESG